MPLLKRKPDVVAEDHFESDRVDRRIGFVLRETRAERIPARVSLSRRAVAAGFERGAMPAPLAADISPSAGALTV